MLAQNLKTPTQLGITNAEFEALLKTLKLFETKEIKWVDIEKHREDYDVLDLKFTGKFNMHEWGSNYSCGSIACIGGTAEIVGNVEFDCATLPRGLSSLFYPHEVYDWDKIRIPQAAQALRNYLTHGRPMWETIFPANQLV